MSKNNSKSFKSYIDKELNENEAQELFIRKDNIPEKEPRLLFGELKIAESSDVLLFERLKEWKSGVNGRLIVTNFKLSFLPCVTNINLEDENNTGCQENLLLGDIDISLTNVDAIYIVSKNKKRRLQPGENISTKVKGLQVVCKTMRILTFSFKNISVSAGKTLTNSLLHHAFPTRHELLFAYDFKYKEGKKQTSFHYYNEVCLYREFADWKSELIKSKCPGWKLSLVNQNFRICANLSPVIIVPESVQDLQLIDASRHFRGSRPPVWCWGTPDGAALVRMAEILPIINERVQENVMLENIRRSHPRKAPLHFLDLQKHLPSVKDIQQNFIKLRELCAPESGQQFQQQEGNYLSLLESTKWIQTISICLSKAAECSKAFTSGCTVVLQEGEGRDLSAIISSLVQLLCNSRTRSIVGFQSLIQKEWISLGHPFCSRLGLISGNESEQSPMFLLFLDCTWQLVTQFPADFEFTDTYLVTLWDSCHIGIFDTFLFDCEFERKSAESETHPRINLRSVWDWEQQFSDHDMALFKNPLYMLNSALKGDIADSLSKLKIKNNTNVLAVKSSIPNIELWLQCYCRWLPALEIIGGGKPQIDFQMRLLVDDILSMQQKLSSVGQNSRSSTVQLSADDLSFSCDSSILREKFQRNPNSFFPFQHHASCSTDFLLNSTFNGEDEEPTSSSDLMMDSQSSLNIND